MAGQAGPKRTSFINSSQVMTYLRALNRCTQMLIRPAVFGDFDTLRLVSIRPHRAPKTTGRSRNRRSNKCRPGDVPQAPQNRLDW